MRGTGQKERRDGAWAPGAVLVPILVGFLTGGALLAAPEVPAQEEDSAGAPADTAGGPPRYGTFVFVEQEGSGGGTVRLLVGPDVNSSLNEGARLFFRCRDGQREVFVAHTSKVLGNARDGAGGRVRFDRLQWSDLIQWGANESGSAAFLPPRRIPEFVSRVRDRGEVEIQLVTPGGVDRTFRFELAGMGPGLDRLGCFDDGG